MSKKRKKKLGRESKGEKNKEEERPVIISLTQASRELGISTLELLRAVQEKKIKSYRHEGVSGLDGRDAVKYKLESDPEYAGEVDDLLKTKLMKKALRPFFPLEKFLDSESSKIVLEKLFRKAYDSLPEDQKRKVGGPTILHGRAMNIGLIEMIRPAYRDNGDNAKAYVSELLPYAKAVEVLYRIGVKKIERAKDPTNAQKIMEEYMREF